MLISPFLPDHILNDGLAAEVRQRMMKERLNPDAPAEFDQALDALARQSGGDPSQYDDLQRLEIRNILLCHWELQPWPVE